MNNELPMPHVSVAISAPLILIIFFHFFLEYDGPCRAACSSMKAEIQTSSFLLLLLILLHWWNRFPEADHLMQAFLVKTLR